MFSSRNISTKFAWLALLFGAAGLSAQIDPNQVNWPTGTTGCVYAPATNTCVAPGGAPTGSAGGDLSGSYPNPGVAGFGGIPFSNTPAPELGDLVCFDGVEYTPCPPEAGAAQILYLTNTASDIGSDFLWDTAPLGAQFTATQTIPATTTKTAIKSFATASTFPDATTIPAGEWQADSYVQVSGAANTTTLQIDVYDVHSDGSSPVLLFSFPNETISGNGTGIQEQTVEAIEPAFTMAGGATDRLLITYSMTKTGGPSITGTLYGGGSANYSHVHTPIGTASGGITQLTGDVAAGPGIGSQAATLATVNSSPGSYTNANITVNGKGLVTVASNGSGGGGLNGVSNKAASYVAVSGDNGKNISLTCPGACGLTLPTSVPANGWTVFVTCEGVAACTITPTSGASLLNAGGVAIGVGTITPGMGVSVWSDGTNYHVNGGGIVTGSNVVPILVQSALSGCTAGEGSCTVITFSDNVTPGDAIIVSISHNDNSVASASDVQGDTFTLTNTNISTGAYVYWEYVVCGAIGGPTTITTNHNTSVLTAYEVSGVAASSCVDGYNSGVDAAGTTVGTGSVTTTEANDFIFVEGMARTGAGTFSFSEANSYIEIVNPGLVAGAINYESWQGLKAAAGSVSDTVTFSVSTQLSATILALKPTTVAAAFVEGDLVAAQPNLQLGALHQGAAGCVWTSNGAGTMPTCNALPGNGISGMTAGQVAIAGSATTITNSKVLAGSGAGITTGPTTSVDQDCAKFTGASGQLADAGAPCGTSSAAGFILLESHTASASATLDFSCVGNASYDTFQFEFVNVEPATDNVNFGWLASTNGGSSYDTSSIYAWYRNFNGLASHAYSAAFAQIADSVRTDGTVAPSGFTGTGKMFNPGSSTGRKQMAVSNINIWTWASGFDLVTGNSSQTYETSSSHTAMTNIRFEMSSGNIASGTIRCYGLTQ